MRRNTPVIIFIISALLSSSATATWSIEGTHEPDTPADRTGGFMFSEPDTTSDASVNQVYFNAIAKVGGESGFALARVNPNLVTGSRLAPPGSIEVTAFLGVWKDCNRDGYIGSQESALWEYSETLLADASMCPPGGAHHRQGWIMEFNWIEPFAYESEYHGENTYLQSPYVITDPEVNVWGDIGAPGEPAPFACAPTPVPRGTTARTGAAIRYLDCQAGFAGTSAIAALDPDGSRGLAFDDPHHPERDCDNRLNRPIGIYDDPNACAGEPRGVLEPDTGKAAFSAYDCSDRGGTAQVRDPTAPPGERGSLGMTPGYHDDGSNIEPMPVGNDEGALVTVPAVSPVVHDPTDPQYSTYEGINATFYDTVFLCGLTYAPWPAYIPFWFVGPWALLVPNPANFEDPTSGASPEDGKRATDFAFVYRDSGTRLATTFELLGTCPECEEEDLISDPDHDPVPPLLNAVFGDATEGFGVGAYQQMVSSGGWSSTTTSGTPRGPPTYFGPTIRSDLQPAAPIRLSFYARVGSATLDAASIPTATPGTYGSESCQGATSGVHGSWDCDATHWWRPDMGAPTAPNPETAARVGAVYNLRDIDCLDGSVGETGVRASLVDLSGEPACGG